MWIRLGEESKNGCLSFGDKNGGLMEVCYEAVISSAWLQDWGSLQMHAVAVFSAAASQRSGRWKNFSSRACREQLVIEQDDNLAKPTIHRFALCSHSCTESLNHLLETGCHYEKPQNPSIALLDATWRIFQIGRKVVCMLFATIYKITCIHSRTQLLLISATVLVLSRNYFWMKFVT